MDIIKFLDMEQDYRRLEPIQKIIDNWLISATGVRQIFLLSSRLGFFCFDYSTRSKWT